MNQKYLFALWGCFFILCSGLGFIPEPEGALSGFLLLSALFSFLPPALLLYRAGKKQDTGTLTLLRNLSALSLGLTLLILLLNFYCALASEFWGTVLHYILVIVSSPMVCSGHWAMSLFLWSCLLTGSIRELRRARR